MRPSVRELRVRYDEEGAYKFPRKFDYPNFEHRAKAVATNLEAMGMHITFEGANHNQDASFSIAILFHTFEKLDKQGLMIPSIRFSNFGNLTSLTWVELIPLDIIETVLKTLESHGFIYVSELELQEEYDGVMPDKLTFSTRWIRYFDWL